MVNILFKIKKKFTSGGFWSSTLLYYISQVIWVSKYSTGWCPPICCARLEMKLPRPNYTKLDPFFLQKRGGLYISEQGFFLGSCRSLFWALGSVFQKWVGFPKKEGGFYALKCFSNVILRDKLAVKHKYKLKTFTELFFTNGH